LSSENLTNCSTRVQTNGNQADRLTVEGSHATE
jgi:hypothetical protein